MSSTFDLQRHFAPYGPQDPARPDVGPDCAALMRLAIMGAIVGGSAAAAQQVRRLQAGVQTSNAALAETGKAALTAGLATAAAGAIASSVAEQGAMRLGIMLLVGSVAAYGLQGRLGGGEVGHE